MVFNVAAVISAICIAVLVALAAITLRHIGVDGDTDEVNS